ncbi:MAG: DotU family type IV/VI secretion system protein [Pirellula sp.]
MNAEFAKGVDPIFIAALDLESRIEKHQRIITSDERTVLIRKIEEAEYRLGKSEEWLFAKYALCGWIDARLVQSSWTEASWWKEHCLEQRFFGHRLADEEFFARAIKAASLPGKNALEVFYIAVVLGFRGIYADSDLGKKREFLSRLRLPDSIEGWCQETVRSLHLKHGRPSIPSQTLSAGSFEPLTGRSNLLQFSMISALLIAAAIVCYILLFVNTSSTK